MNCAKTICKWTKYSKALKEELFHERINYNIQQSNNKTQIIISWLLKISWQLMSNSYLNWIKDKRIHTFISCISFTVMEYNMNIKIVLDISILSDLDSSHHRWTTFQLNRLDSISRHLSVEVTSNEAKSARKPNVCVGLSGMGSWGPSSCK